MALVPLEVLWCQCQGNASATPHQVLIHQQMTRMHAEAQGHALWYVAVVLTLYILGLTFIIRRSGRSERHTAVSAISFCLSRAASSLLRRTTASRRSSSSRRQQQQQQQQKREAAPRTSTAGSSDFRQQTAAGAAGAGPSLQLHLLTEAKEEATLNESCLTTVA
ncbi:uncharacterized protein [Panulirus ornatus]|uniref:uncharacterized protein n=1 Tax=Panulirus ornatus TaxID=150431 RepID=UPI003A8C6080